MAAKTFYNQPERSGTILSERVLSWNNYYCGPYSHENVAANLQIKGRFTQWPKQNKQTKINLSVSNETICFRYF